MAKKNMTKKISYSATHNLWRQMVVLREQQPKGSKVEKSLTKKIDDLEEKMVKHPEMFDQAFEPNPYAERAIKKIVQDTKKTYAKITG